MASETHTSTTRPEAHHRATGVELPHRVHESGVHCRRNAINCRCTVQSALRSRRHRSDDFPSYPQIRRRPTLLNVLSTVTAVAGLIFSVVGLAYAQILTRRFRAGREHDGTTTFVAWTCKWSRQGVPAPAIFKTVCKEGRAVVVLMGVVIGLEVLALAVCAWGWSIEAKVKKAWRESVAVKGDERL